MGRPAGSKNKPKVLEAQAVPAKSQVQVENVLRRTMEVPSEKETKKETKSPILGNPKTMAAMEAKARVDRAKVDKAEPSALGPGQKYFESPEGDILIGEDSATRLWHGKTGKWILPKR